MLILALYRGPILQFKLQAVTSIKRRGKLQTPNPTLPITDTPSSYCGSDALEQVLQFSVSHSSLLCASLAQSSPKDSQLDTHLHASLTSLKTPSHSHVQRLTTQRRSTLRTTNWMHITERLPKQEVSPSYSHTHARTATHTMRTYS